MAPCIESLIVLDRLLYLKEQVINNISITALLLLVILTAISGLSLGGMSFRPNQITKMSSNSCFKINSQIRLTKINK